MDGDDEEEEEGEREEEDAREEDEREQVEGEVDSQVPSGRHGMPALAWSACTDTACCGEQVTTAKMQSKNEDATGTGVRVVSPPGESAGGRARMGTQCSHSTRRKAAAAAGNRSGDKNREGAPTCQGG